jgi:hypothetical protein
MGEILADRGRYRPAQASGKRPDSGGHRERGQCPEPDLAVGSRENRQHPYTVRTNAMPTTIDELNDIPIKYIAESCDRGPKAYGSTGPSSSPSAPSPRMSWSISAGRYRRFESEDALIAAFAAERDRLNWKRWDRTEQQHADDPRPQLEALLGESPVRPSMASDSGWLKACAPARRSWNNRSALCVQHKPLSVKRLEPGHVFEVQRIR